MPRFVLLEHDHPTPHWDLMLEAGEGLRTWRLDAFPRLGTPCSAKRIADHRRIYLDYEGPVAGGRGTVRRVAAGEFVWGVESPARTVVELRGGNLSGRATLGGGTLTLEPLG